MKNMRNMRSKGKEERPEEKNRKEVIQNRLQALREVMKEQNFRGCWITGGDPHGSEMPAAYWETRSYLSGFTGSAGLIAVTMEKAGIWVDSRYFIQVEREVCGGVFQIFKTGTKDTPRPEDWLCSLLSSGDRIATDGRTLSVRRAEEIQKVFSKKNLLLEDCDLLGRSRRERPALPSAPVWEYPHAGRSRAEKFKEIRSRMNRAGAGAYLISAADDLAWILNLRGKDELYSPVFAGYLLLRPDRADFFIVEEKYNKELKENLERDGIIFHSYAEMKPFLRSLAGSSGTADFSGTLLSPEGKLPFFLKPSPEDNITFLGSEDPVGEAKALKNKVETEGTKEALREDSLALIRFFYHLEKNFLKDKPTEKGLIQTLEDCRRERDSFHCSSFSPIIAAGSNSALCHYNPATAEEERVLKPGTLLLVDSGGQYEKGTTDITRCFYLKETPEAPVPEAIKKDYTLVLKAHIALSRAVFPRGTDGSRLDALVRSPLWQEGLDFGHGTGHGVGHFLHVHEGPQSISSRAVSRPFLPGMLVSNEPGLYREGAYGLRIENLILCREAFENEFGEFLRFETLTLFPYEPELILSRLLHREERDWLEAYHQRVFQEFRDFLPPEERAWLAGKTAPLS